MTRELSEITIYPDNSPQVFKKTCDNIEHLFPDFERKKLLIDVDGSTIQSFEKREHEIIIYDDYDIGAVFVKTNVKLPIRDFWETHKRLSTGKIVTR